MALGKIATAGQNGQFRTPLRLLKPGGRGAVIVPDGVLFGSSKAHKELRRILMEDQKLDAVLSLPSGVFRP